MLPDLRLALRPLAEAPGFAFGAAVTADDPMTTQRFRSPLIGILADDARGSAGGAAQRATIPRSRSSFS